MKVLTLPQDWYPDDINSKLNFDQFSSDTNDKILLIGLPATYDVSVISYYKKFKKTAYLNLEHPCSLYGVYTNNIGLNVLQQQLLFDEVYTICPYTAEWFNSFKNIKTKFFSIPYVHNLKYNVYQETKKDKDVAYCGLIHSEEIASYINTISKFNYIFTTIKHYNKNNSVDNLATHNNIDNIEKWNILSKTKISIIQNNLYLNQAQINNIKQLPMWEKNKAFSHIDTGIIPQLKSRVVESIICKNLLLVKKDNWNVIERWLEPEKDFIYFENTNDLEEKLKIIIPNWENEKYQNIISSAYDKVISIYNTQYAYNKIKNGDKYEF